MCVSCYVLTLRQVSFFALFQNLVEFVSAIWSLRRLKRLSFYVSALVGKLSSSHLIVHGFGRGAAVSLALRSVSLSEIMDHIGWKSSKTALHYIKLKQVVNSAGAAAKLADLPLQAGQDYKHQDHLVGFSQAFS